MIEVLNLSSKEADIEGLKRVVRYALEEEGVKKEVELSVILLNKAAMTEINREHRGKEGPTDVLSFGFSEGITEKVEKRLPVLNLGQVFVCPAVVEETLGKGEELSSGLARALAHGLLHILGYNHKRRREEKAMMKKQGFILKRAGF